METFPKDVPQLSSRPLPWVTASVCRPRVRTSKLQELHDFELFVGNLGEARLIEAEVR
jgi:hypothetical protein